MGTNKAELEIGGRPILEFLLGKMNWAGPTMLVTSPGRERPRGSAKFDRELVDPVARIGPLRGVLTALENSATPLLLIVTVDMPGVGREQLDWLTNQPVNMGIVCCRLVDGAKQIEPFPLLLHTSARPTVIDQLNHQRRSVQSLSKLPGFDVVEAPGDWDPAVWTNLNTPADWETFTRKSL